MVIIKAAACCAQGVLPGIKVAKILLYVSVPLCAAITCQGCSFMALKAQVPASIMVNKSFLAMACSEKLRPLHLFLIALIMAVSEFDTLIMLVLLIEFRS